MGFSRQEYWSGVPLPSPLVGQSQSNFQDMSSAALFALIHLHLLFLKAFSFCFQVLFQSFSSVQSLCRVRLFATPCIAARQASLSITNFWSPPKPMSIESVMPSNHLIFCRPLLLLPSIFSSIRVAKVLEFQIQHQSFQ